MPGWGADPQIYASSVEIFKAVESRMLAQGPDGSQSCFERFLTVFDDERYSQLAQANCQKFRDNQPFPHVVIDNFLPEDLALLVAGGYPDPNDESTAWKSHSNKNVVRKFVEDVRSMTLPMRLFASAVASRQFLLFLETLSGIDCLLPDPYFIGGGAMLTGTGQFLKIHADFNWHHKLQAHRRLNALLYLTANWQPEWGGALELWSKDMSERVHSVLPEFNRLVVFEVTDDANHGQPEPLNTPPGIYRRVFSAFYYTTRRDEVEWNAPHFTLYKPENSPYGMRLLSDYQRKDKCDQP
jgi:hypothetical protein